MILVTPEKNLSLQDLLDNAECRLGINQFAGGAGLDKRSERSAGLKVPAGLPALFPVEAICIVPLRSFPFSEGVRALSCTSIPFHSRVNLPTNTCVAFAGADQIPETLARRAESLDLLLFSSRYDEFLLESRLIGLIREKTERRTSLSGGLVNLDGMGIVITGESGLGKTSCALELVRHGHRWVADDVVVVERRGEGLLYGRGYDFESPLLEIKGWGIVRAEDVMAPSSIMHETRIDFLIELAEAEEVKKMKEQGISFRMTNIMGIALPCIPMAASRDASHTAAEVESCVRILQWMRR